MRSTSPSFLIRARRGLSCVRKFCISRCQAEMHVPQFLILSPARALDLPFRSNAVINVIAVW